MNKAQILSTLGQEVKIVKHLFTKVKTENLNYAPAEKMRTLEELLRYLSYAGVATINWYCSDEDDETSKVTYKAYVSKAENFAIENFATEMDAQLQEISVFLDKISEEDFSTKTVKIITGKVCTFNEAIVNTSLKYLTAYRLQLFIYLKQLGFGELNTFNCWVGIDKPMK